MSAIAAFLAGIVCGILIAWSARASFNRHRDATEALPPPDTIDARNARSVAEWERRRRENRGLE